VMNDEYFCVFVFECLENAGRSAIRVFVASFCNDKSNPEPPNLKRCDIFSN
jgi:hypothetical protein